MKSFNEYIVNSKTLINNINKIRSLVGSDTKICAVVKANAYGIGQEVVCKTIRGLVDFFACACVNEAIKIRQIDKTTPILILGNVDYCSHDFYAENNLSISIGSLDQLNMIKDTTKPLKVHLQVNTGLNRFGFKKISEFKKALNIIGLHKYLILEGVYSHFATKKNDTKFIGKQHLRFLQFKRHVKVKPVIFHISNSFATENFVRYHYDMVRVGMLAYGLVSNKVGTKPVVTIKSTITSIMHVAKGESIGYDRTFFADKNMIIGIVPIGYADGFCRKLSNNFNVCVNDKMCRVVGLVCMDAFMVDISNSDTQVGSEVLVLGEGKGCVMDLCKYATALDTSPYEVICSFNHNRMEYIYK